jgi:serine/threonine-protein kinase RsbW
MGASETVSVPATSEGVRRALDAFDAFGASRDLPPDSRWRFQVAIDELLSNIVRHGVNDRTGQIELTFSTTRTDLAVSITDGCAPFNPLSWPAPPRDADLDGQPADGRGIALVRALMDDVQYERRDAGNHVVISRRLGSRQT